MITHFEGFNQRPHENQRLQVIPGSPRLLYTDGETEARNEQGESFLLDGLLVVLLDLINSSAQGLCDHPVQTLLDHYGKALQVDDIAVVAIKAAR